MAIAKAKELANIQQETGILTLPAQKTFIDRFIEEISKPKVNEAYLSVFEEVFPEEIYKTLAVLSRILEMDGIAALLPENIEIK